jgi:peptidoglycan/xylan/chitin deacetylase (PgdA/CDA1 family)
VSQFVISLDFELFWGVADVRSLASYRTNVEGEWSAVPKMLALFREYEMRVTWATVGMVMCRDYGHWRSIRPTLFQTPVVKERSPYSYEKTVREHPKLFFARPLVDAILQTPGQEIGSHTYSHFCCNEGRSALEQFEADLVCMKTIASSMGISLRSQVFPRNQIFNRFVAVSARHGMRVFRGNSDNWIYRKGDSPPYGLAGRATRFADSWLPITGDHAVRTTSVCGAVNVPASLFMRPWSRSLASLEPLRLNRLKQSMTAAARAGAICHLWWHPHNFGVNLDQNLAALKTLLDHYRGLHDRYGMRSACMGDFFPGHDGSSSPVAENPMSEMR